MELPQLIIIVLGFMGLGIHIAKHGKKTKRKYNGWLFLIAKIISWTILYYGGFWDNFFN